jgi:hypothetical protein
MNCPQWVVDAVLKKASALTLKGRCQVSGLRFKENLTVEFPEARHVNLLFTSKA